MLRLLWISTDHLWWHSSHYINNIIVINKVLSLSVSCGNNIMIWPLSCHKYLQHLEMALFAVNQNLSDTILYVQCPQSNIVIITITKIIMNMRWSSAVTRMVVKLWPSRWWFSVKTTVIKKSSLANRRDRDQKEQVLLLAEIGLLQKDKYLRFPPALSSEQAAAIWRQHTRSNCLRVILFSVLYSVATNTLHSRWTGLIVINVIVSLLVIFTVTHCHHLHHIHHLQYLHNDQW